MIRLTKERIDEAKRLRKSGLTFSEISKEMGLAKSTLHYWLCKISRPDDYVKRSREEWMKIVQPMGAKANKLKRLRRLDELQKKVENELEYVDVSNKHFKKTILAMLYWTEGAKGRNDVVVFANTDPRLIKLFGALLRDCFDLDESKFRVRMFLHYYHNEKMVKQFWSNLLNIDGSQFQKTYRKKRGTNKTYRRNQWGICFLIYHSMVIKEELMKYGVGVAGMIK